MPHVIVVEPHPIEQRRFLRALRRVGATVTGVGSLRPEQVDGELRHLLESYESVPGLSDGGLSAEDALLRAVRRIQERGPWVDRLEGALEPHLAVTARVRVATSIPGLAPDQVELTQDKIRLKRFLREHGIYSAPSAEVTSPAQALAVAGDLGFPLVLKPRIGSGLANVHRVDDAGQLAALLASLQVGQAPPSTYLLERFADGHEGFYDGLVCQGQLIYEAATHFYPSVLTAMRDRSLSPIAVHTNRLAQDGYNELRSLNQRVLGALSLETTPTHLEWFSGPEGLWFSELGLHLPPDGLWELYSEASDYDLHTAWANAVCFGSAPVRPPGPRWAAGLVSLRPTEDGVVVGYEGVETMQRRYGEWIFRLHLPPPGTRTQPIDQGYLANAYVFVKHPDYDVLRSILHDIGSTVRLIAQPSP
jgi:hypothetical protein